MPKEDGVLEPWATARRRLAELWSLVGVGRGVTWAAAGLIVAELAFHAWAVFPSWFFLDDYNFLYDGQRQRLDLSYMLTPYSGHLMPGGRVVTWIVSRAGTLDWGLAATGSLVFQALASVAAWWMLVTLFGHRKTLLFPLALYLTSPLTAPTKLWWIASVSHLPVQIGFFSAVACWVMYLRTRHTWPLVGTVLAVLLGVTFDVRGILTLPVLAFVAVAYFGSGSLPRRLLHVLRTYLAAWTAFVVLGGAYTAYYVLEVPPIANGSLLGGFPSVASTLLGRGFGAGVLGGPWRWEVVAPPTAFADTPTFLVPLCWVVIILVVAYLALRRTRTLRAWALLLAYLVATTLVVASARAAVGSVTGREYRYLTDAACVVTLCVALATHTLIGAVESSEPRERSALVVAAPRALVVLLCGVILASGIWNSATYAHIWHHQNASDPYMHRLQADARRAGHIELAQTPTPEEVLSRLVTPRNNTHTLASLLDTRVDFPSVSRRLLVVGQGGALRRAHIELGVASKEGPSEGCGWHVTSKGLDIPLNGRAFQAKWWMRIGYLTSGPSNVTITAGDRERRVQLPGGLGNLFLRMTGTFDSVRIDGLEPGQTMCVDRIEVGLPVAGGSL